MTTETTAARYVGGHAIDVTPVAHQAPGQGGVRIDVAFTGSCGTDLQGEALAEAGADIRNQDRYITGRAECSAPPARV